MPSYANIRIEENTGRSSSVSVRLLSAATDAQINTFITNIKNVILGKVKSATKSIAVASFTPDAGAAPTGAQRGQKWLVRGTGAGVGGDGDSYTLTIPTADPADIASPGGDQMDISAAPGDGIVTALQAIWADENDIAMVVDSIEYRNYTLQ